MAWKHIFGFAEFLFGILLAWMIIGREGKRGPAKVRKDAAIEFGQGRIAFWGRLIAIPTFAWSAGKALMQHHAHPWDFLSPAVLALIALFFFFTLPGTVVVTDCGLEQTYWFWKSRRIRWHDIVEIEANAFSSIKITGTDGTKVTHTSLLADRPRFLLEIQQHCDENLPPEFNEFSNAK